MTLRVSVCGLWHLGSVTAACVAEQFSTIGYDPAERVIEGLSGGRPPLHEPGLAELTKTGLSSGRLRFTHGIGEAVRDADVVWVCFDTPVGAEDEADVSAVEHEIRSLFPHLRSGTEVLISSQVPVGSTQKMESEFARGASGREVSFSYSPENLRLGKALDAFRKAERVVVGTRAPRSREILGRLLAPFAPRIEWMSVESAEMTKHALNAFFATSVVFANEVASLCEVTGADASEVERGLRSEPRIGPKAYLRPGSAFAGGTLARDVRYLVERSEREGLEACLMRGVAEGNRAHRNWPVRVLERELGEISGKSIALWGLTYKAGTDTLRRSPAVELAQALRSRGAEVCAFDSLVRELPAEVGTGLRLCSSAAEAVEGADALVVTTDDPEYRKISGRILLERMRTHVVVDADRYLEQNLAPVSGLRYRTVGRR